MNFKREVNREEAFTLIELMVTIAVFVAFLSGFFAFYRMNTIVGFESTQTNTMNSEIRAVGGEISSDGREASYFLVYPDIDSAFDSSNVALAGASGDAVVFVSTNVSGEITRIVSYFGSGGGPVYRWEREFPSGTSSSLDSLGPTAAQIASAPQVIDSLQGMAAGDLFFNLEGTTVVVSGELTRGNAVKSVSGTYNLTITPRG